MKFYQIIFSGILLITLYSSMPPAHAGKQETYNSIADIPSVLTQSLGSASYEEQYISNVLVVIRKNASNHIALTKNDLEEIKEKNKQQNRQRKLKEFVAYDSNFDGNITSDEIEQLFSSSSRSTNQQQIDAAVKNRMKADLDGNGIITTKEIVAYADQTLNKSSSRYTRYNQKNQVEDFLSLDPNDDGTLTVDELRALAIKAFHTIDSDHDGILSPEEKQSIYKENKQRQALKRLVSPECTLPKPEKDEKIVFIGVYEGKAVSTISVAGQVGETNVIPVQIDQGDQKLYIVTSAFSPVIWQFKGNTNRISKLVLAGRSMPAGTDNNDRGGDKINVGETGVAADKVTFRHARTCGLNSAYNSRTETKRNLTLSAIGKLLGQQPDLLLSKYSVTGIHIFGDRINTDISNEIEKSQKKTPKGFEESLWKKHIRFMPGGVIDLKDEEVISDAPAVPYEVLPKWAGFSKLAYEGAVVPENQSSHSTVTVSHPGQSSITLKNVENIRVGENSPRISFGTSDAVKIIKNIPYYPSGLYGGYLANIIIGKGVTPPKGTPGHSTVISEETGEQIAGPGLHIHGR